MTPRDELDTLADELSEFAPPAEDASGSPLADRVLAGFEEIQRWVQEHRRNPENLEGRDVFERLYAVRLHRIHALPELRALVEAVDHQRLLVGAVRAVEDVAGLSDDELAAQLDGIAEVGADVTELRHVRSRKEIEAAEEVASRKPCPDFEVFRPLFTAVQADLKSGRRQSLPFNKDIGNNTDARIRVGDFYIVGGQFAYVAEMGEIFYTREGAPQAKLRVIYGNGTESDLLMRSLQNALYKDVAGRRITQVVDGPLFAGETDAVR